MTELQRERERERERDLCSLKRYVASFRHLKVQALYFGLTCGNALRSSTRID